MGKIYKEINDELFTGVVPDRVAETYLTWKGSKMPFQLWGQMVALGIEITRKHKAECMCRMYYKTATSNWALELHPQTLEAELHITDSVDSKLEGSMLKRGYEPIGTMHTHANSAAFQSDTDSHDELHSGNGLHITLGNLSAGNITVDLRYSYNGEFYKYKVSDWVQVPPEVEKHPYANLLRDIIFTRVSVFEGFKYPSDWNPRITEAPQIIGAYSEAYSGSYMDFLGEREVGGKASFSGNPDHNYEDFLGIVEDLGREVSIVLAPIPLEPFQLGPTPYNKGTLTRIATLFMEEYIESYKSLYNNPEEIIEDAVTVATSIMPIEATWYSDALLRAISNYTLKGGLQNG